MAFGFGIQRSEVGIQRSDFRGQKSEVGFQRSDFSDYSLI